MKSVCVSVLVWLAAQALPVGAADFGLYTIVEGNARVLRGATWSKLVPGARAQDGDVLDVPEGGTAQVESPRGGMLNMTGPAAAFAGTQSSDGKSPASEWVLARGWFKAAGDKSGLRLRTTQATIDVVNGIVVVKTDADAMQMFVETGSAKVTPTGPKQPLRDAHEGEWWSKMLDKPLTVDTHGPQGFVTGMPRPYIDALPKLAPRYAGSAPALKPIAPITFAEAEPWLTGPYRSTFIRRLQSRLTDPAFRVAVEGRAANYPEWDRLLHPERYP
ncbi:MAG TPA: hypothetical protein VGI14_17455 [Casimicrobiaceae bacterium]|jgi:hypothetical protein